MSNYEKLFQIKEIRCKNGELLCKIPNHLKLKRFNFLKVSLDDLKELQELCSSSYEKIEEIKKKDSRFEELADDNRRDAQSFYKMIKKKLKNLEGYIKPLEEQQNLEKFLFNLSYTPISLEEINSEESSDTSEDSEDS